MGRLKTGKVSSCEGCKQGQCGFGGSGEGDSVDGDELRHGIILNANSSFVSNPGLASGVEAERSLTRVHEQLALEGRESFTTNGHKRKPPQDQRVADDAKTRAEADTVMSQRGLNEVESEESQLQRDSELRSPAGDCRCAH